jgi:hypothetical protein
MEGYYVNELKSYRHRKILIAASLVLQVLSIIFFCVATSVNPCDLHFNYCRQNKDHYFYNDRVIIMWVYFGPPVLTLQIICLGLASGLVQPPDNKVAMDIGISLAVFSGIGIASAAAYLALGTLLLTPSLSVPAGVIMFVSFLMGIILGGIEADYRKKLFRLGQWSMNYPDTAPIVRTEIVTPIDPPPSSQQYLLPLWVRKVDSAPGSEVRIEIAPEKYVVDLLEEAMKKLPFPLDVKVGSLKLLGEDGAQYYNTYPLSSFLPHQRFLISTA